MVSFWLWKGDSSSTASFEKTLSTLSTKITDTQSRLDKVRASSRRARVLWTLYLSFAYLVYAIVLLLVVGHKNMGAYEWTGLAGGPVLIWTARTLLAAFYNFRVESLSARLKEQQEERAKTIQKLKDATKYDSTMELIEKYGGAEGKPKGGENTPAGEGVEAPKHGQSPRNKKGRQSQGPMPSRTSLPPPPTANIQRGPDGFPLTPQGQHQANPMEPGAEFAPNADDFYSSPAQPALSSEYPQQRALQPIGVPESHWYDRVFDVLLGEDETAPKNRIVLICQSCRLVNGQAPPGTKSLAELGTWRCMQCGQQNGEVAEDEGQRIVREVLGEKGQAAADRDAGVEDGEPQETPSDAEEADAPPSPVAEGVRKRRGKGGA